jgi:hypothetical protein
MVPDTALQVTAVLVLLPLTVAVNCCWPLRLTVALCGLTETLSFEVIVIVAVPFFLGSALLVAVTVSVPPAGTLAGAV